MKVRGKVKQSALEGGLWLFEATDGSVYQLKGGGEDLLTDGVEATVEGNVDSAGFSIGMAGDILVVESYTVHS